MPVGIHRLGDGGVTEPGLNHLRVQVGSDQRQGGPPGRARRHGAHAFAPLTLPLRRRQRRAAGAKSRKPGRLTYSKFHRCTRGVPAPAAGLSRGRSEPIKAVCDRRTTAAVKLPGERTREDDLDRTYPDQEMAAIGSRDTSGQGLDLTLKRQ